MTRKRTNILLAVLMLSLHSKAQFHYTALLDTVKATGFYHIVITPELSSYLKTDLSDLRIFDEKKQGVPYIVDIADRVPPGYIMPFSLNIIKKETVASKTTVLIENAEKRPLTFFTIDIKNADAERLASLSGSDDKNNWFVVVDSLLLKKSEEKDNSSHTQQVNFPWGNYKYLKLTISNSNKEPLNIISVSPGYPSMDTTPPTFLNPVPTFSQTDSAGYSLVKITNTRPFHMSTIKFTIRGQWLYKRQAKLFTEIKSDLQQTWNSPDHATFTISSDKFFGYPILLLKAETFYMLIKNGDNPPLRIASVSTEQVQRRVMTQLEEGIPYSLLLDNPQATARKFDLQYFRDRIHDSTAIHVKKITALPQAEIAATKKQIDKWWIWPAIILIVLLLTALAWKLTADMKKKNESERI